MTGFSSRVLSWKQPLLPQVVAACREQRPSNSWDLSHLLLVLPTNQSIRQLDEALARAAAEDGKGLLSPRLVTPRGLFNLLPPEAHAASRETVLFAWAEALGEIDLSAFQDLFPLPPKLTPAWKLGLSRRLRELQETLAEKNLDFAAVAHRVQDTHFEPRRWQQLARLEATYWQVLQKTNRVDPLQRMRQWEENPPPLPNPLRQIILCAVPDPFPPALGAIRRWSDQHPVEVWIYGPTEKTSPVSLFEPDGRPSRQFGDLHTPSWPQDKIHLAATPDPREAFARSSRIIAAQSDSHLAIGLTDPALTSSLTASLQEAGIEAYDPGGITLRETPPGYLTELYLDLLDNPGPDQIRPLLHHPVFIRRIAPHLAAEESILRAFDRLQQKHLPHAGQNLLQEWIKRSREPLLVEALQKLDQDVATLRSAPTLGAGMRDVLRNLYQPGSNPPPRPLKLNNEELSSLATILNDLHAAEEPFPNLAPEARRAALREMLRQTSLYPDHPEGALPCHGWIELLWIDAPHLIIIGLNEGQIPEHLQGDAFLPESLRQHLGLKTNQERLSRDQYLLASLLPWRCTQGRVDLLVPSQALDQSPLKPSRLLFPKSDDDLLERLGILFPDDPPGIPHPSRSPAIRWRPPPGLKLPEKLSFSSLALYLQCPFRFFLTVLLGWREEENRPRELDPGSYGTALHEALQFLTGKTIHPESDFSAWQAQSEDLLRSQIRRDHGEPLSFALALQQESLLSRLRTFWKIQEKEVRETRTSFQVIATEETLHLEFAGLAVRGRLDRLDLRADQTYCILDYKTANTAQTPEKKHLFSCRPENIPIHLPPEAVVTVETTKGPRNYIFADLQLPLYTAAVRRQYGSRPLPAYVNLPQSQDAAGFAWWPDCDDSLTSAAEACAEAIITRIKAGVFWPPNPRAATPYDSFSPFFPEGIEESVEADCLLAYPLELS